MSKVPWLFIVGVSAAFGAALYGIIRITDGIAERSAIRSVDPSPFPRSHVIPMSREVFEHGFDHTID